jgi:hypothetical protein
MNCARNRMFKPSHLPAPFSVFRFSNDPSVEALAKPVDPVIPAKARIRDFVLISLNPAFAGVRFKAVRPLRAQPL